MASTTLKKIVENVSNNKNVQSMLESFSKLSEEIKKLEKDLIGKFDKEKDEKVELAWKKYQELIKVLSSTEKKLHKEVNTTLKKIKKSSVDLEKNVKAYGKKATKKVATKVTTKKASAKASPTTKKVAKKATKKATKKA